MTNIWNNSTRKLPESDEQIVRVSMEQIDIGGRKSALPAQEKSSAMTPSHVPNNASEDGISKLVAEGWMPDGIAAVRKLMEEKAIIDPAIAAAYYEKTHPPAAPVAGGGGPWNFIDATAAGGDDPDWKKLIETKGE